MSHTDRRTDGRTDGLLVNKGKLHFQKIKKVKLTYEQNYRAFYILTNCIRNFILSLESIEQYYHDQIKMHVIEKPCF